MAVEGAHDVAADASASLPRRWSHLSQQIDVTVRRILEKGGPVEAPLLEDEQRAIRAGTLVQVGELCHAREVLEGADLAPGNQTTLDALRDETADLRTPANQCQQS